MMPTGLIDVRLLGSSDRCDLRIADGVIAEILPPGALPRGGALDAAGALVCPAFVDLHVDFGVPGSEWREGLASGLKAAAAGGFAAVCQTAATEPANDTAALTRWLIDSAAALGGCRLLPIAALTPGRAGEGLAELFDLASAGAAAFGDDRFLADTGLFRRALEYSAAVGLPVFERPLDPALAGKGVMHEGPVSTRLGLKGSPSAAENIAVARAIALVEQTGAQLHLGPISTEGAVDRIRAAKRKGLPITASVCVANLVWTDEAVAEGFDSTFKVSPPLRSEADRAALRAGVCDGTIDAVSSGHMPQSAVEKSVEFDLAAPGMSGLETCLGLMLALVDEGVFGLEVALETLSAGGQRALRQPVRTLAPGAAADLVVIDLEGRTRIDADTLQSRAKNSPVLGRALPGVIRWTLVGGKPVAGAL